MTRMVFVLVLACVLIGACVIPQPQIVLRNPTVTQVNQILAEIDIEKVEGNCCDKSKYIQDYFYDRGYQCWIVVQNWQNGEGHISVSFQIGEDEWLDIEPSNLAECSVMKDKTYSPDRLILPGTIEDRIVIQFVRFR